MEYYSPPEYQPTPLEQLVLNKSSLLHNLTRRLLFKADEFFNIFGRKAVYVSIVCPDLTFDNALPQGWLDHWQNNQIDYSTVLFGTVWAYPEGHLFGLPFPVTQEAEELIKRRDS
jgi:hypothetical protein